MNTNTRNELNYLKGKVQELEDRVSTLDSHRLALEFDHEVYKGQVEDICKVLAKLNLLPEK